MRGKETLQILCGYNLACNLDNTSRLSKCAKHKHKWFVRANLAAKSEY